MDNIPMPTPDEALTFLDSVLSTVHANRQDHIKMQQSITVLASVVREHSVLVSDMQKDATQGAPLAPPTQDAPQPPAAATPFHPGKPSKKSKCH